MSLISDLMSDSVRATGLSALMKGAGLVTRFIPIPQPTLLVGPGSSARLGQAIAGFGHSKILIVTDSIISKAAPGSSSSTRSRPTRPFP